MMALATPRNQIPYNSLGSKYDSNGTLGTYLELEGQILAQSAALSSVAIGLLLLAAPDVPPRSRPKYHHGVIIRFDGEIGPGLEAYFYRKLEAAKEQGADLVILEIDSPGGG